MSKKSKFLLKITKSFLIKSKKINPMLKRILYFTLLITKINAGDIYIRDINETKKNSIYNVNGCRFCRSVEIINEHTGLNFINIRNCFNLYKSANILEFEYKKLYQEILHLSKIVYEDDINMTNTKNYIFCALLNKFTIENFEKRLHIFKNYINNCLNTRKKEIYAITRSSIIKFITENNNFFTFNTILKDNNNLNHKFYYLRKDIEVGENIYCPQFLFYKRKNENFVFLAAHKSAFISENVMFSNGIIIMNDCFIGENVNIGEKTFIGKNCVIHSNTTIGKCCIFKKNVNIASYVEIGDFNVFFAQSTVGSTSYNQSNKSENKYFLSKKFNEGSSLKAKSYKQIIKRVTIGKGNIFYYNVSIESDTFIADRNYFGRLVSIYGKTRIGSYNFLAGNTVLYYDCLIGSNNIFCKDIVFGINVEIASFVHLKKGSYFLEGCQLQKFYSNIIL